MAKTRPERERKKVSREEWVQGLLGDINPMKYAGEGWFATEEYAKPEKGMDPWLLAEMQNEGAYYPRAQDLKGALRRRGK